MFQELELFPSSVEGKETLYWVPYKELTDPVIEVSSF
jgi:hypothetical protein